MSRKIVYHMQMSLDGYIEDRTGSIDFGQPDEELHTHFNELDAQNDTHIYGRRLYENMNAYWPTAADDPNADAVTLEYARIWNGLDKLVFSHTLKSVEGRARLATGDIASEVAALKAREGKNISLGGAGLAQSFIELDLVDEYWVFVYPVILGGGKPMFGDLAQKVDLKLKESRTFGMGVVSLIYERA